MSLSTAPPTRNASALFVTNILMLTSGSSDNHPRTARPARFSVLSRQRLDREGMGSASQLIADSRKVRDP